MVTLLLVRHARTATTGERLGGWTPGVDLDGEGRGQAEALAARLSDLDVAAVYASPLERTQQTAQYIADRHGLRVRTRRGIGEVDYGDWTNRTLKELRRRKLWKVVQATPSQVTFPGGESIRGAQLRAVDAVEAIAREHRDELVVAVSHADIIKAVVAFHLGMPLDTFQRLVVGPASVTTLVLGEGAPPIVVAVNTASPAGLAGPA